MRVFSETNTVAQEVNDTIDGNITKPVVPDSNIDEELKDLFTKLAGEDKEISAYELQTILNAFLSRCKDIKTDTFSINTCRDVVNLMDNDVSGKLGLVEFQLILTKIQKYLQIYKKFDTDFSGTMNSYEMQLACKEAGFTVNQKVHDMIVRRYASQDLTIDFDNFIDCLIRLEILLEMFKTVAKDGSGPGTIVLNLEQWINFGMV
nr:PREDICTED: calpain-1 catalytic subunit-like [Latimeria chalumnae]|eukprot:XP_014354352.1 PREDICTED: calpain-1 catalytic subunit-like [Latimeria chalumnae]